MGQYLAAARRQRPHAGGAQLAGLARELRRNADARRQYRQDVLGIANVNQATPEQLAAAAAHGALPHGHLDRTPDAPGQFASHSAETSPGGISSLAALGARSLQGPEQLVAGPASEHVMSTPGPGLATLLDQAAAAKGGVAGGRPVMGATMAGAAPAGPTLGGGLAGLLAQRASAHVPSRKRAPFRALR